MGHFFRRRQVYFIIVAAWCINLNASQSSRTTRSRCSIWLLSLCPPATSLRHSNFLSIQYPLLRDQSSQWKTKEEMTWSFVCSPDEFFFFRNFCIYSSFQWNPLHSSTLTDSLTHSLTSCTKAATFSFYCCVSGSRGSRWYSAYCQVEKTEPCPDLKMLERAYWQLFVLKWNVQAACHRE